MSVKREILFEEAIPPRESEIRAREALAHAEASEALSAEEALLSLRESAGWRVVERRIMGMRDDALAVVVNSGRGLEEIRFAQGVLDALGRVIMFIEKGDM